MKATLRKNGRMMFTIQVPHAVGLGEIISGVFLQMQIYGNRLPVNRKECFDYVIKQLSYGSDLMEELEEDVMMRNVEVTVKRLFPELL